MKKKTKKALILKRENSAAKTWNMIERMMTGDFNPNHDPDDGRFTSGSGGTLTPRKYNKSFFSQKRADQHVEYLKSQGATEIQTSSRKDAFGQNEYIVGWNMEEHKSAPGGKMKDPAGYFKRASSMSGLKPIFDQMDKESKDNVATAVYTVAASPGGRDATLSFGRKSIKVTAPSKEKRVAKQYGIHWTGSRNTPTVSYHGDTRDLATHLIITLKDLGYKGEKITMTRDAIAHEYEIVYNMTNGVFSQDDDHWVTINGTHVLIGEGGEIKGGPDGIKQHYSKKSEGGSSGSENAKPKRLPRGRGHEIITPSDNMTKEERADLQELEYQAYEFLEERCKDNDEDFMDLWGVSEPYDEDGITYVDAEYNVVTKSGKRVDRASQVPVSPKNKKAEPKAAAKVSETSTHGKIVDQGGGQWYGENDDGSSVSILDGGKEDYNLWKYGSRQIYEVQPVDKDLNWGKKEYYGKKSEAMAAAKAHLKRMSGEGSSLKEKSKPKASGNVSNKASSGKKEISKMTEKEIIEEISKHNAAARAEMDNPYKKRTKAERAASLERSARTHELSKELDRRWAAGEKAHGIKGGF